MDLSRAAWRKSSHSGGNQQNCVEIAANLVGVVAVRDSKNPGGGAHVIGPATFRTFIKAVKHDHLAR